MITYMFQCFNPMLQHRTAALRVKNLRQSSRILSAPRGSKTSYNELEYTRGRGAKEAKHTVKHAAVRSTRQDLAAHAAMR